MSLSPKKTIWIVMSSLHKKDSMSVELSTISLDTYEDHKKSCLIWFLGYDTKRQFYGMTVSDSKCIDLVRADRTFDPAARAASLASDSVVFDVMQRMPSDNGTV